ncbi:MAG: DUF3369 domain-containing protein, partial [Spirochaetota bacterium]
LGRSLRLHHAFSAEEARDLFRNGRRFAVALIDVVMETNEAGLDLIEWIRKEGYESERLVLRTGQPGYAPELSVLKEYDINDYRTKNELTSTKLMSVLITAIRSYHQFQLIRKNRIGLIHIIDASANLFLQKNLGKLSHGILTQITNILDTDASGLVSVVEEDNGISAVRSHHIVSAIGRFCTHIGQRLTELPEDAVCCVYQTACDYGIYTGQDGTIAMTFPDAMHSTVFVYVESGAELDDAECELLRIFAGNINIAFRNLETNRIPGNQDSPDRIETTHDRHDGATAAAAHRRNSRFVTYRKRLSVPSCCRQNLSESHRRCKWTTCNTQSLRTYIRHRASRI